MGGFPFPFRSRTSADAALDRALAANFAQAATEEYVDDAVAAVASTGGPPTGAAGGDLSGTYPNPSVVDDSHTHDGRYYTEAEVDTLIDGRASDAELVSEAATRAAADVAIQQDVDDLADTFTGHHHDTRYYTQGAADALLAAKAAVSHTHAQADVTNLVTDLAGKQPLDSDLTTIAGLDSGTSTGVMATEAAGWVKRTYAQVKTSLALVKGDVGLGNVDNTSDANKPVSTATQTALDLKAPITSPTFLVSAFAPNVAIGAGLNIATIGAVNTALGAYLTTASASATYATIASLAATQAEVDAEEIARAAAVVAVQQDVDDLADEFGYHHHDGRYWLLTTDLATQAELDTHKSSSDHDGRYYTETEADALLAAKQPLDADLTTIAGLDSGTSAGVMTTDGAGWLKKSYAAFKTLLVLVKADVGLGNVDNTSDANKPVSTAQQAALDLKASLTDLATNATNDRDRANHTGTQAATTVTVAPITNLTATEVQAALAEHQSDIDGLAAGSGIPGSTMDAKGDLIVGTADNAYARRAAPANGRGVVADSTQSDGWRDETLATAQSVQDIREEFEGHHHDEQYRNFLVAQDLGTSGYFATSWANIHTPNSFFVRAGRSYLITLTATQEDGASGGARYGDYRFHDGTNVVGSTHSVRSENTGKSAVAHRAIYTPTTTGVVTISPQAQCTSATPAIRAVSSLYTVQPI